MLRLAGAVRDAGLAASGRPGVITYSRKVFIPLTTLCRDRCHYCIFVDTPAQLLKMHKPTFMSPEQVLAVVRQGAGARLQGGAAHARRPPRGSLARGPGLARRARLRLDARLRRAHRAAHHRRDRDARAPEPGRHDGRRAADAAPHRPVDGDDARDDLAAALRGAGSGALRLARQGSRPAARRDRGRRARAGAVHHRHPGRHRRDAARPGRVARRAARRARAARARAGGHRPELPREAADRDAGRAGCVAARVRRRGRRRAARDGPAHADPGAAEPLRPRRVRAAACAPAPTTGAASRR